jgi:hypothetical protein
MIVDPAPGALVRDPATTLAITAGTTIDENDPYWARLLVDGDVAPAATSTTAPRAATNREGAEK